MVWRLDNFTPFCLPEANFSRARKNKQGEVRRQLQTQRRYLPMCGIAGAQESNSRNDVSQMVMQIKHRGPDGDGVMPTEAAMLGHTRLAIVDVDRGHQPLQLGDAWIAFNGEIYNHMALRKERLKGQKFGTHTDTETVLRLYQRYGPKFV